jgi:eukaryotic-like serine/threonine-protein kinase
MSDKITGNEPTIAVPVSPAGAGPSVPPAASEPAASLPVNSTPGHHVFAGRYEILGLVGAGGMGTVYRARDRELDEIVALKLLQRAVVDQPGMLDRFRQEVKLARRVTHRNVARTYDIGEHEGEKFLTMELIEGESLAAKLARSSLSRLEGMAFAEGVCAGLEAAHAAGIVHRDLKPDNILMANEGRVVITDFGIARALSDAGAGLTVGMALGTPAYMSPEQVEGRRDVDARADIYALGAILYECMTGEPAWTGDNVWAVAAARLTRPPPDVRAKRPDLPPQLSVVVQKCMARNREDRYASAEKVMAALRAVELPWQAPSARASSAPQASLLEGKAIAVLPFLNKGAADDAYLADALFDDLVDSLSMAPGLRVLSRGAVERFRDRVTDAREVGRELRVAVVVEGSVRRAGRQLRVTARLVSVADGFQLWAKRFDRPDSEVLTVSDDAANAIAEALSVRRSTEHRASPTDPKAIELYLRARHLFFKGWRGEVAKSVTIFEEALALAPNDPTILSGYARSLLRHFLFQGESQDADDVAERARAAADRALAVVPEMPEPRAVLANLKWMLGDAAGCARDVRAAIRVAPSSTELRELSGRVLVELGELERGIALLESVLALEPALGIARTDLVRARALLGDWSALDGLFAQADAAGDLHARAFFLVRLSMWRRDVSVVPRFRKLLADGTIQPHPELEGILSMLDLGVMRPDWVAALLSLGKSVRAMRRRSFLWQVATEAFAYFGDHENGLRTLEESSATGLLDLSWLDRCPLLADWRDRGLLADVRARVAARATVALDCLDGRIE